MVPARRQQGDAAVADRGRPGAAGPGGGTAWPSRAVGGEKSPFSPAGGSSGACCAAPRGVSVSRPCAFRAALRGGAVSPAPGARPEIRRAAGGDGVDMAGVWAGSVLCCVRVALTALPRPEECCTEPVFNRN